MILTTFLRRTASLAFRRRRFPFAAIISGDHGSRPYASNFGELPQISRQKAKSITNDVITLVDDQISKKEHGRLFAVVQVDEAQYKITDGDIIVLNGDKSYEIGDSIRLEKILCIGSQDFTLFGRPLIPHDLVNIEATVIEKTLGETYVQYRRVPRKSIHNFQLLRDPISLLRINRIELNGSVSR